MARRQAILSNKDNLIRTATLSATAPLPCSNTVKPLITSRTGSGRVVLSGAYTGTDDAQIDVRIATGGSAPRVSDPVYSGAGNGRVEDLAVDAATAAQTFTLTLVDLGTDSAFAEIPFFHGILRARSIGAGGNDITVTLDPSNTGGSLGAITRTATSFSVLADIPSGLQRLVIDGRSNAEFNFGGLALISGGKLDPATPRIQFGGFPKVYRQYFKQEAGDRVYYLDDETARPVPAGTVVYNVTGAYRVIVSDGVTTENYTDVITQYDILRRLLASQLVEFDGVVVRDETPDGMAAAEIDLITASIALNPQPQATQDSRTLPPLAGVSAPAAAPTQTVVIECVNNNTLGAEQWSVTGTSSGAMSAAVTGQAYSSSAINFTIPAKSPADSTGETDSPAIEGDVTIRGEFQANDGENTTFPVVCLEQWVLGPNARPMTIEFTLEKKPDPSCACGQTGVGYPLDPHCVGADSIDFTAAGAAGGDTVPTAISTHVATQYDAIWDWYESHINDLVRIFDASDDGYESNGGNVNARYANNVSLFQNIRDVFLSALNQLAAARDADLIDATGLSNALTAYAAVKTFLDSDTDLAEVDTADTTSTEVLLTSGTGYPERYRAKLGTVFTTVGLVPNFEGTGAGGGGGPCWFDDSTATNWWRVEADGDQWAHWHTGFPFYSVVERRVNGAVTYERLDIIGALIEINCSGSLQIGDKFFITIKGAASSPDAIKDNRFYQIGDRYSIDVIFGGPLGLQGGVSGDDTHTWAVVGSVLGPLADYEVVHDAEDLYDNDGGGEVEFTIYRGGRPAALGDKITFSVETAQYQYQVDGGGYNTLADLPAGSTLLTAGLSIEFVGGKEAPNWANLDVYSFDVLAKHQIDHIRAPGPGLYRYSGATATITATFASDQAVEVIAFPVLRDLPVGFAIGIRGLSAADAELWTHTMTARDGMLIDWFDADDDPMTIPARKLEITLSTATAAALGWVFAGAPVHPAYICTRSYISPSYFMGGDSALQQQFFGAGYAGLMEWDRDLSWNDLQALYGVIDYAKRNGNQPVVAISDPDNLDIVGLLRINTDQIQVDHVSELRPFVRTISDYAGKGASLSLPFAPVYQP